MKNTSFCMELSMSRIRLKALSQFLKPLFLIKIAVSHKIGIMVPFMDNLGMSVISRVKNTFI